MTTPEAALAALQVAIGEDRIATQRAVIRLHDAGYALTPLAPEVPPRRDGLRERIEALPTHGMYRVDFPNDPTSLGLSRVAVLAVIDNWLAATRTPEPPDSGDGAALPDVIDATDEVTAAVMGDADLARTQIARRGIVALAARLRSGSPAPSGGTAGKGGE